PPPVQRGDHEQDEANEGEPQQRLHNKTDHRYDDPRDEQEDQQVLHGSTLRGHGAGWPGERIRGAGTAPAKGYSLLETTAVDTSPRCRRSLSLGASKPSAAGSDPSTPSVLAAADGWDN